MTYEQALRALDHVGDYLRNAKDAKYPLTTNELESLIEVVETLGSGLQTGLTQNVEG